MAGLNLSPGLAGFALGGVELWETEGRGGVPGSLCGADAVLGQANRATSGRGSGSGKHTSCVDEHVTISDVSNRNRGP